MGIVECALLALSVSIAATPIVLWLLRRVQILDLPTSRSSHEVATPRGGGVAPAIACVLAIEVSNQISGHNRDALLVVAVGLGLIGLADDLRPRGVLQRILGQIAVIGIALIWLIQGLGGNWLFRVLVVGALVIWLALYVNVFNFMDGINGLAVAQVVIGGLSWWVIGSHQHVPVVAASGLIAAAAALGFAPFNVPQAKVFLGDVGSYFFGGWMSVTATLGIRAGIAPEAVIAPLSVFVLDAGTTLVKRVCHNEPWSQPHKQHAYQRLVQAGWSHHRTTLVVALIMTAVTALGTLSLTGALALRVVGDLAGLVVLAGYFALPYSVARHTVCGSAPSTPTQ